ncbi:hypothetical protein DFH09DRAFT_1318690 [Mycena vulgaris]|nr:hypothetical protein DFH09DRAFT_1318690 [Mycena vulgaris]
MVTREEDLLAELLAANTALIKVLKHCEDLSRVAIEHEVEDHSRKRDEQQLLITENATLHADAAGFGGSSSSSRSPSPACIPVQNPTPRHQVISTGVDLIPLESQRIPQTRQTLVSLPAAPRGPRSAGAGLSHTAPPAHTDTGGTGSTELAKGVGGMHAGREYIRLERAGPRRLARTSACCDAARDRSDHAEAARETGAWLLLCRVSCATKEQELENNRKRLGILRAPYFSLPALPLTRRIFRSAVARCAAHEMNGRQGCRPRLYMSPRRLRPSTLFSGKFVYMLPSHLWIIILRYTTTQAAFFFSDYGTRIRFCVFKDTLTPRDDMTSTDTSNAMHHARRDHKDWEHGALTSSFASMCSSKRMVCLGIVSAWAPRPPY